MNATEPQELSNSFAIANSVEPTSRSADEIKQELAVAQMRDYIIETLDSDGLSITIDGKAHGLTKDNALDKLTCAMNVDVELDETDKTMIRFLVNEVKHILFQTFNQTPPTPEHIEATYNAAMQSVLDVLREEQSPHIGHDNTIEAG